MKAVGMILGASLIIMLMPAILISIVNFRATDYTEEHIIALSAPATSTEINLSQKLFGDNTFNVSITSNHTEDAPIPQSYTSLTRKLTVTGLDTDSVRRLTILYKIPALEEYWGADVAARSWPLFIIIGVIGIFVGAVVWASKRGGE